MQKNVLAVTKAWNTSPVVIIFKNLTCDCVHVVLLTFSQMHYKVLSDCRQNAGTAISKQSKRIHKGRINNNCLKYHKLGQTW